jgi:hypothetical protein
VPILAEEAVEGAGLIKDGQVFIAIFGPITVGELGIACPCSPGANPIGDAIGGQGVIIPANIPLFRSGPDELTLPVLSQSTVAFSAWGDEAFINTKITSSPPFILGGLSRKVEGLPRLIVHPFDMGPKFFKMGANTIGAKLQRLGDEKGLPATAAAFDNRFSG